MKKMEVGSTAISVKSAESSLQQFVIRTMQWAIVLSLTSDVFVSYFVTEAIEKAERGEYPGVTGEDLEEYFCCWPEIIQLLGLAEMATMEEFYEAIAEIALARGEDFTWEELERTLEHVLVTAPESSSLEELVKLTRKELTLVA